MPNPNLLMIPGPIGLTPEVLRVLAEPQRGHLDPVFMQSFASALKRLRQVLGAFSAQPFLIAGSGTLAMEMAVANLIEPNDTALVVNTGYFSDRIATMLELHGASVTHVRADPGDAPSVSAVEQALSQGRYKVMTITHVDTSTAVLAPVRELAALAKKYGVLCIVDAVCSAGGEALEADEWGIDVVFSASQKALGAPPGLAVLTVSPRALDIWRNRRKPVAAMYLDFAQWLPIHQAYEAGSPSYFATPPVNLIMALDVSLAQLLEETMPKRVARHHTNALAMQQAFTAMGLELLSKPSVTAHTLSAVKYPAGVDAALVKSVAAHGVSIAGGLHPSLKATYFRVGHMGSVTSDALRTTLNAIERGLVGAGHSLRVGAGTELFDRLISSGSP